MLTENIRPSSANIGAEFGQHWRTKSLATLYRKTLPGIDFRACCSAISQLAPAGHHAPLRRECLNICGRAVTRVDETEVPGTHRMATGSCRPAQAVTTATAPGGAAAWRPGAPCNAGAKRKKAAAASRPCSGHCVHSLRAPPPGSMASAKCSSKSASDRGGLAPTARARATREPEAGGREDRAVSPRPRPSPPPRLSRHRPSVLPALPLCPRSSHSSHGLNALAPLPSLVAVLRLRTSGRREARGAAGQVGGRGRQRSATQGETGGRGRQAMADLLCEDREDRCARISEFRYVSGSGVSCSASAGSRIRSFHFGLWQGVATRTGLRRGPHKSSAWSASSGPGYFAPAAAPSRPPADDEAPTKAKDQLQKRKVTNGTIVLWHSYTRALTHTHTHHGRR